MIKQHTTVKTAIVGLSRSRLLNPVALVLLVVSVFANASNAGGVISAKGGVAIGGYDPVAYFTMGEAVVGSKEISHEFLELKWRFANAEHKQMFVSDPLKYIPQYGGYCANAGNHTDANPEAFQIVDGKLYLFGGFNAKRSWSHDDPWVARDDAKWEKVKAGLAQ